MLEEDYIGEEPSVPGRGASFWLDTTDDPKYPKLSEDIEVDVAIVGGGFVGIMTAFLLSHLGKKVAVLEARNILADVTGHTTAKLTAQHGMIYDFLTKKFGKENARIYARANKTAIKLALATIEELKIRCDLEEVNSYLYTEEEEMLGALEREAKAAEAAGINADFITRTPLPFSIRGAVVFPGQYQFHPRKFLIPVAEEVARTGGLIFEKTRVVEVVDGADICEVKTETNTVRARSVVVATNFPIYDTGNYYIKLYPSRSYVLAASLNGRIPEGIYYSAEKGGNFRSFRSAPYADKRLWFIGGESHKAGVTESNIERYKALEEYAKERFPIDKFHYHWSTQDNKTFDNLPYIGLAPKSKRTYIATGFKGWGMTMSLASAVLLSNLITGRESAWEELFDPGRLSLGVTWKKYLKFGLSMAKNYIGGRAEKEEFEFLTEIPENSGKVREIEGEKTAVFRNRKGEYFYTSPYCTHMGCVVNWNDAEKTWDCPCHGSRYDKKGKVIHSPAKKDLTEKPKKEES